MTNVMKTTKRNAVSFTDQSFFQDFNWSNFEYGDIVWLEDYHAKDFGYGIAGVYAGGDGERIYIRTMSVRQGKVLAQRNVENINDMASGYWQQFLELPIS